MSYGNSSLHVPPPLLRVERRHFQAKVITSSKKWIPGHRILVLFFWIVFLDILKLLLKERMRYNKNWTMLRLYVSISIFKHEGCLQFQLLTHFVGHLYIHKSMTQCENYWLSQNKKLYSNCFINLLTTCALCNMYRKGRLIQIF